MRPVWKPLQPFLTRLTGQPLAGEPLTRLTPWNHLTGATGFLLTGVAVSAASVACTNLLALLLLPMGWLLTLHGARKLRTIIMHQAAHHNFTRREWIDHPLGKIISLILIAEEFDEYRRSHCSDHHSSRHQTLRDPTVAFLFNEIGLRPGMARREMWRRLLVALVSPRYHARFLAGRVRSHFRNTSRRHRVAFCAFVSAAMGTISGLNAWPELLLAWVIPVGILYQVSAAFRLSSEHVFPRKLPAVRNRSNLGAFTLGIFAGAPAPSSELPRSRRWVAWCWWWSRMLFLHLPCRLAFLPGDGPVHDWHHRHPMSADWPNYIHNRAYAAAHLQPGELPYTEVWGFLKAIDACFASLSEANPDDYPIIAYQPENYSTLVDA